MKNKQRRLVALLAVAFLVLAATSYALARAPANTPAVDQAKGPKLSPKVLVEGAALGAASNGITIGPDGHLYIASVLHSYISVMDTNNGKILYRYGAEDGVYMPDDLVFGPDGSLYWTEIIHGNVARRDPDGVVTKQFVSYGTNPITFSPDGRLFVGLCFFGDGLYELDPDLIAPPRPIIEATPANPYPLGFLNAFSFGPDGRLYGPIFAGGIVVSVDVGEPGDPPSESPWTDGTIEVVATGFSWPAAAKFGPDGKLYVVDQTGEVFEVDHTTGHKTVIAVLEAGLDNIAFDSKGRMYVSNADYGTIAQILPGKGVRTILPGGMVLPTGVAAVQGPNGQDLVYVADYFRLREFNGLTGKPGAEHKGHLVPSADPPSLTTPQTVSADGDCLVIASWSSGAVQVWHRESGLVLEHYAFPAPINAIRFMNDIVVADPVVGGVFWASDGEMILPMDEENVFLPVGLVTDGERLWVADWATGIVWQLSFDDRVATEVTPIAFGLEHPEAMALDLDGSILVREPTAGRISRIDPETWELSVLIDGLEPIPPMHPNFPFPPTYGFEGLAVGPSGAIYFSDWTNCSLYRIWPR